MDDIYQNFKERIISIICKLFQSIKKLESYVTHLTRFQKLGKGYNRIVKPRTFLLKNMGQNIKMKYQQIEHYSV